MSEGPRTPAEEELQKLQQAYARVFEPNNPYVELVIQDLAKFCRATETCFHADPRIHAVLEGRRETWLRIDEYSTLSFEKLLKRHILRQQENLRKNETSRSTTK